MGSQYPILGYSPYFEPFLSFRKEWKRKRKEKYKNETNRFKEALAKSLSCPVVSSDFRHVANPYVCMQQHGMYDHFRLLSGSSPFHVAYQALEASGPHRVTELKHVRGVGHGKVV
jgi:hypothetical protein